MKVTVCCGELRVVVPCDDGTIDINELTNRAATRIGKIRSKNCQDKADQTVVISLLKTEKDAILYGGDAVKDVLDDHDVVNAIVADGDKSTYHNGSVLKITKGFNHIRSESIGLQPQTDPSSTIKIGNLAKLPSQNFNLISQASVQPSPGKASSQIHVNHDPDSKAVAISSDPSALNAKSEGIMCVPTAAGIFQYTCIQCSLSFNHQEALAAHMASHGNAVRRKGPKEAECLLCHKILKNADNLKKHMYIHSDKRPFQCEHCIKRFRSKSDMRVHVRIHTGEKPYHCTVPDCGKSFNDRSSFRRHGMSHRGVKRVRNKQVSESTSTSTIAGAGVIQLASLPDNNTTTTPSTSEETIIQPTSNANVYPQTVVQASDAEMQT